MTLQVCDALGKSYEELVVGKAQVRLQKKKQPVEALLVALTRSYGLD